MGLSWPVPGHYCCHHRLLWPAQLPAGLSVTQGSPTLQERLTLPMCTLGTLPGSGLCPKPRREQDPAALAPALLPALEPRAVPHCPRAPLARQEHIVRAVGEMRFYQ